MGRDPAHGPQRAPSHSLAPHRLPPASLPPPSGLLSMPHEVWGISSPPPLLGSPFGVRAGPRARPRPGRHSTPTWAGAGACPYIFMGMRQGCTAREWRAANRGGRWRSGAWGAGTRGRCWSRRMGPMGRMGPMRSRKGGRLARAGTPRPGVGRRGGLPLHFHVHAPGVHREGEAGGSAQARPGTGQPNTERRAPNTQRRDRSAAPASP